MIELVQHYPLRIGLRQQRLAKGMKRRQRHGFATLARGFHDAPFHLTGGLFRERQPKNVFAGERTVRLQQMPNPLGALRRA